MERRRQNRSKDRSRAVLSVLALLLAFVLIFPALPLWADPGDPDRDIRTVMESPRYQYARWGLCVLDLASEKTVYAVNADTMFGPASVTKLFTAAAALGTLGREYTFQTVLYRQGTVDRSGALRGNLILVTAGDFYLSNLRSLAQQVKASGIRAVTGDIVVDDRLFKPYRVYSVSRPGRLLYTLSPAMIRDNQVEITIRPTRVHANAAVTAQPSGSWLRIVSRVRTVGKGEAEKIDVVSDASGQIAVNGQIPEHSPAVTRRAAVTEPASLLRSSLIEALRQTGVRVQASSARSNNVGLLPVPEAYGKSLRKVAERSSPPLHEYIRNILKISHNQGADMLPLLLAVKNGRDTFEAGMAAERTFLAGTGIDLRALSLSDGSGISASNLVTPRTVVQLLKYMTAHRDYESFRGSLPVLGSDGTLADAVGKDSPARGKVLAKTGTVDLFDLVNDSGFVQIKSLAGYMTAASGRQLVFALFVNHVHPVDAPDRKAVVKLTGDVAADVARIAEILYAAY